MEDAATNRTISNDINNNYYNVKSTHSSTSSSRKIASIMTLKDWGFSSDTCHKCGIHNSEINNLLMQCGKCKMVYYCSMKCFNGDLVEHQKICGTSSIQRQPESVIKTECDYDPINESSTHTNYSKTKTRKQRNAYDGDDDEQSERRKKTTDRSLYSAGMPSSPSVTDDCDEKTISSKSSSKASKTKKKKKKDKDKDKSESKEKKKEKKSSSRKSSLDIGDCSSEHRQKSSSKKKDKPKKIESTDISNPSVPEWTTISIDEIGFDTAITDEDDDELGSDSDDDLLLGTRSPLVMDKRSIFTPQPSQQQQYMNHQDFLHAHTISFVDPQQLGDHMGWDKESFDDNSILSDLAGCTIEVVINDGDGSDSADSGNISDVTFDGIALLGDDDSNSNDDDSFLWEGSTGGANKLDNTDTRMVSRTPSFRDNHVTTCIWNGSCLSKDPELVKEKMLSCKEKPRRTTSGSSSSSLEDRKFSLRKSNHKLSDSTHSTTKIKSERRNKDSSAADKQKKYASTRENDTTEDSRDLLPNHIPEYLVFDKDKLNHVKTVKKEYTWLVPEWVNGLLLRRKKMSSGPDAGRILSAIEVLPEDPDYYDEGEAPPGEIGAINTIYGCANNGSSSRNSSNHSSNHSSQSCQQHSNDPVGSISNHGQQRQKDREKDKRNSVARTRSYGDDNNSFDRTTSNTSRSSRTPGRSLATAPTTPSRSHRSKSLSRKGKIETSTLLDPKGSSSHSKNYRSESVERSNVRGKSAVMDSV